MKPIPMELGQNKLHEMKVCLGYICWWNCRGTLHGSSKNHGRFCAVAQAPSPQGRLKPLDLRPKHVCCLKHVYHAPENGPQT